MPWPAPKLVLTLWAPRCAASPRRTQGINNIDFAFVHKLAAECPAKIIAEGHIHYPEQAVKALETGAFALVVGGAITRPAGDHGPFHRCRNAMNR